MAKPSSKKTTVFLFIIALGLGIFAWIEFWMLPMMRLGYVDSAIGRVRAVVDAENEFIKSHPQIGFTCSLSELTQDRQVARLARNGTENGYAFTLSGCQAKESNTPISRYHITARPLHSELPAYCSDESGILKSDIGGSIEKCIATGVPQ